MKKAIILCLLFFVMGTSNLLLGVTAETQEMWREQSERDAARLQEQNVEQKKLDDTRIEDKIYDQKRADDKYYQKMQDAKRYDRR